MDYEKYKLTPQNDPQDGESDNDTAATRAARAALKAERDKTEQFKRKYFAQYDDIKINHREDW